MSMIIKCENSVCDARLRVPDSAKDLSIRCPNCGSSFTVAGVASFVIFDLETTGLYPDGCEIIQIAATRFRNGDVVEGDAFFSYCDPGQPISQFISSYTGITNGHVRNAPRPVEALREFSKFVGDSVLMAHNGHRFDIKFLAATCARNRVNARPVESIDTISFSKRLFGTTRGTGHSLDRVMHRLGLSPSNYRRHDARGDIAALADCVKIMWKRLGLDPHCGGFSRAKAVLPALSPH
jgi:DNA polymerase III epsilon subunit family exonuclease